MTQRQGKVSEAGVLFFGGRAFLIEELGPAADMVIDKGLQALVDSGILGDFEPDTSWVEVFGSDSLSLEGPGKQDISEELLNQLWLDFKEAEHIMRQDHTCVRDEDRKLVEDRFARYKMARKLSEV